MPTITPEIVLASPEYNVGGLQSVDQIIDLVTGAQTGNAIVDGSVELLDLHLNPVPVPGQPISDPYALPVHALSVEIDVTSDVVTKLSMQAAENNFQWNPFTHRLRGFVDYYASSTEKLLHIPLATVIPVVPNRHIDDMLIQQANSGMGILWLAARQPFMNQWTVPVFQTFTDAANQIMTNPNLDGTTPAGCPCPGPGIPAGLIKITPDSQFVPSPIPFTYSSKQLVAANQLLRSVNYRPLYDFADGSIAGESLPYYTVDTPVSVWQFSDAPTALDPNGSRRILWGGVDQSFPNREEIANVVELRSERTGHPLIIAVAENHSQHSFISIENVGKWVAPVIDDPSCPSYAVAQERVLLEIARLASLAEQVEFKSALIPFLGAYVPIDVEIHDPITAGLAISSDVYPFQTQKISMDVRTGMMTVTAGRIVFV